MNDIQQPKLRVLPFSPMPARASLGRILFCGRALFSRYACDLDGGSVVVSAIRVVLQRPGMSVDHCTPLRGIDPRVSPRLLSQPLHSSASLALDPSLGSDSPR
jgi:hypothetical protein